jgi:hypothetical protein
MSLDESAAFWDSVRENILIQSVVTVLSYEAAILWRQASRNSGIEQARSGEVRYQSELNKTGAELEGVFYAVDAHENTGKVKQQLLPKPSAGVAQHLLHA